MVAPPDGERGLLDRRGRGDGGVGPGCANARAAKATPAMTAASSVTSISARRMVGPCRRARFWWRRGRRCRCRPAPRRRPAAVGGAADAAGDQLRDRGLQRRRARMRRAASPRAPSTRYRRLLLGKATGSRRPLCCGDYIDGVAVELRGDPGGGDRPWRAASCGGRGVQHDDRVGRCAAAGCRGWRKSFAVAGVGSAVGLERLGQVRLASRSNRPDRAVRLHLWCAGSGRARGADVGEPRRVARPGELQCLLGDYRSAGSAGIVPSDARSWRGQRGGGGLSLGVGKLIASPPNAADCDSRSFSQTAARPIRSSVLA